MAADPPGPSVASAPLRVEAGGQVWTFDRPFTLGRDASCDVALPEEARVSRRHLEIAPADDGWWITDLGSANGTLVDGERVARVHVTAAQEVQVGEGGPVLRFTPSASTGETVGAPVAEAPPAPGEVEAPDLDDPFRPSPEAVEALPPVASPRVDPPVPDLGEVASPPSEPEDPSSPSGDSAADGPSADAGGGPSTDALSYDAVVEHYFGGDEDDENIGERTRFIRRAYDDLQQAQATVQKKERSRYQTIVIGVLAVSVLAIGYAGYLQYRINQLRAEAQELFYELRTYEIAVANEVQRVQAQIEADPENADSLTVDLERAREARRRTASRYDQFVRRLGVYDGLSSEEEAIYRVARAFGESELTIPDAFVDEVQVYVNKWKRSGRFQQAVRHAQVNGFDVQAVNALRRHGMPTEFFYLSLQESNFDTRAVGPWTRYGHAKGAWQFIPETGRRYGLEPGPLVATNQYDPLDERHDFGLAADAAARYLHDIYSHLAQASGLLVCASYNWGEGRIKNHMRGIANDPAHRTYWRFLTEYRSRMPAETKDYVLNIFAAAVIGQNPRMFGIDMDPPVQVALAGGRGGIAPETGPTSGRTVRFGTGALQQRRSESAPAPGD